MFLKKTAFVRPRLVRRQRTERRITKKTNKRLRRMKEQKTSTKETFEDLILEPANE
jgi:hypothetical protein